MATIKYYVRERLLPRGVETSDRSMSYDASHIHRLLLIRTLADTTNLTISQIKEVLGAINRFGGSVHQAMAAGLAATHHTPHPTKAPETAVQQAQQTADRLLREHDWEDYAPETYRDSLLAILTAYYTLGYPDTPELFTMIANAAAQLAAGDLDIIDRATASEGELDAEWAVTSLLIGETLMSTLHRIAHTAASSWHQRGG